MSVRYDRQRTTAFLEIDRPQRRNAIDGDTAAALLAGFERFRADDQAAVLVLSGAGDEAFCAGADLKAIDTLDPDAAGGPLGFTRLHSPKPTIAAVGGWCVAGGFELALWCDVRIASETATFGFLERRWGVPLIDGGTQRLPRIVGEGRALELVLTGREVDAAEALRIGLVTAVVPAGEERDAAAALADRLAAVPQATLRSDRDALLRGAGLPLADGLALEAEVGRAVLPDAIAGAARFAGGAGRGGTWADDRRAT